ncbi:hypothetical protein AB4059_00560 [Lysobacter sp. 2RAF19]
MTRLFLAVLLTPLALHLPFLIPPYETFTFWWFRLLLSFSYAAMFLFGVPLLWLFVRKRWTSWWQCIVAALAAATLFLLLWFFVLTNWEHFLLNGLRVSLYAWAVAVVAGGLFWLIAFWRNPRFTGSETAKALSGSL